MVRQLGGLLKSCRPGDDWRVWLSVFTGSVTSLPVDLTSIVSRVVLETPSVSQTCTSSSLSFLHVCVCVLCVCFADVEGFSTAHNALSPSGPHLCQLQARVAPSTPLLLPPSPSPPDKERTAHHILEILPPIPTHYTHSQSLSLYNTHTHTLSLSLSVCVRTSCSI